MKIKILTTGGTFDKLYFDAKSEFHFGEPIIKDLLTESNVTFDYDIESLMKIDSLEMTDRHREQIYKAVIEATEGAILITHGTDTMVETAQRLADISDKTIVIFGSMQPARMRYSDALFNLGFASAAVQTLPQGVYLAMNGQIFDPAQVEKNRAQGRFQTTE